MNQTSASTSATTTGPRVEQTRVILGENSPGYTAEGEIVSTQTVSSKTRTVETITVSIIKFWNFFSRNFLADCFYYINDLGIGSFA